MRGSFTPLRYGGPVFAEGDELVVGTPDDAEPKKDAAKGKDKQAKKDPKTRRRTAT